MAAVTGDHGPRQPAVYTSMGKQTRTEWQAETSCFFQEDVDSFWKHLLRNVFHHFKDASLNRCRELKLGITNYNLTKNYSKLVPV